MEVKIGVQNAPREIVLESPQTADEVEGAIAKALEGTSKLLVLADEHGRRVIVPAERLAYVEIGRRVIVPAERLAYVEIGEPSIRKVGFGTL